MNTARDEVRTQIERRITVLELLRSTHIDRANDGIITDTHMLSLTKDCDDQLRVQHVLLEALNAEDAADKAACAAADKDEADEHFAWVVESKANTDDPMNEDRAGVVLTMDVLVFVDREICGADATNRELLSQARSQVAYCLEAHRDMDLSYVADWSIDEGKVIR